jgi:exonuclease III
VNIDYLLPKITLSSINVLYEKYYIKYCVDKQNASPFLTRRDLAKKAFEKLLLNGIDFICLQEWSNDSFALIDLRNFTELSLLPAEKNKTPTPAILYNTTKYELINTSSIYLESSKGICKGEFKSKVNSKILTVLSVHVPFSSNIDEYNLFYATIEKIVQPVIAAKTDFIIAGDFNGTSQFIDDANMPIYKKLSKVDFGEQGTCRTSRNEHKQFDHIFYNGNLKIQNTSTEPVSMESLVPHTGNSNSVDHFSDHAIITAIFQCL